MNNKKYAELLLDYSLEIKPNQKLYIKSLMHFYISRLLTISVKIRM